MKSTTKILWGLCFIFLGIIIGLNSLEITNIDIFFNGWWTLFIIIPCFINLFNERNKIGNMIGLIIGIALLLATHDVIRFDIVAKLIIPLIFVGIGFSFIFNNTLKNKINEKIKNCQEEDLEPIIATFAEEKICKNKEKFTGAHIEAIFGGVNLDLRDAKIVNEAVIKANAIFGGIEILLPTDTIIKVKSTPIFGGVSNNTSRNIDNKKIIYLDAVCLFGGIDIK